MKQFVRGAVTVVVSIVAFGGLMYGLIEHNTLITQAVQLAGTIVYTLLVAVFLLWLFDKETP